MHGHKPSSGGCYGLVRGVRGANLAVTAKGLGYEIGDLNTWRL